jgi:hypothetical protein
VYELALKGEQWACNMIVDRIDGKAETSMNINVLRQDVRDYSDDELLAMLAKAATPVIDVTPKLEATPERKPDESLN